MKHSTSSELQGGGIPCSPMVNLRVNDKYRLGQNIGENVYLGTNVITGRGIVIKLESIEAVQSRLEYEASVYDCFTGGIGFPMMHWFGTQDDYNAIVLDRLGPTLQELLSHFGGKFPLKALPFLANQLVSRIEYIHSKSFIYSDIKPDSFAMGVAESEDQVNVISLGRARKHDGVEHTFRHDMESLGYLLLYLSRGSDAVAGLEIGIEGQGYEVIKEIMVKTPTALLCDGQPKEFATYLDYARSLSFNDKPDYSYLRGIFHGLFVRECSSDWMSKMDRKSPQIEEMEQMCRVVVERAKTIATPSDEHWQVLCGAYRGLLRSHQAVLETSQHPAASPTLRELVEQYLTLLQERLPTSKDHMLDFVHVVYKVMTVLMESVPDCQKTWAEYLRDLANYRREVDPGREIWNGVSQYWETKVHSGV